MSEEEAKDWLDILAGFRPGFRPPSNPKVGETYSYPGGGRVLSGEVMHTHVWDGHRWKLIGVTMRSFRMDRGTEKSP